MAQWFWVCLLVCMILDLLKDKIISQRMERVGGNTGLMLAIFLGSLLQEQMKKTILIIILILKIWIALLLKFNQHRGHSTSLLIIVNPSLVNVSVAFQDTRTGSDTRLPVGLFKVGAAASVTDFQQNQLSRFNFSYAG